MQQEAFRVRSETSVISLVGFVFTGILLAFLAACGGSSPAVGPVAVTAGASTVDGTDTTTLSATVTNDRNAAGVTWSASAGTLSNQTASSATFAAPAATGSSQTVTITATSVADSTKTGTATITVPAAPAVTSTSTSLAGSVGTAYSVQLAASGGISPYTWSLGSGTTLPACLALKATGVITTTSGLPPTASCAGTYSNLIFKVTDSGTPTALTATSSALSITISAPTITFNALTATGSVGTAYTAFSSGAAATGALGTTIYTLNGSLPASGRLAFNSSTGQIAGTPHAADAGTYSFTITATDQYGDTATSGPLSLKINAAPAITFGAAPTATATDGVSYSSSLSATGGAGSLTYTITAGSLPTGLTLNSSSGGITGTPAVTTAPQAYNFTAQAGDSFGDTPVTQAYTINVSPGAATHFAVALTPPTTISAGSTANFTVTALDALGNQATGYAGTAKFTSSDARAVLPANATLTSGVGSFGAILKTAGSQTITATDNSNASITGTSGIVTVNPGSYTQLAVIAPGAATKGTAFNFTVTAEDAYGNTETGNSDSLTFTSTDGAATLPGSGQHLTNGTGTFSATLNTNGNQTITATDTTVAHAGTSNAIAVSSALTIATAGLNPLDVGQAATQVLSAAGGSGNSANYSWSWTGTIPPGLSLSTGGAITGTPTTAGTYPVTVKVTDSTVSESYSSNLSITIDPALSLPSPDPASLPSTALAGYAYNSGNGGSITGSGGSGNLSISAVSGLPADGLSATASGSGTGAPILTVNGTLTTTPTPPYTVTFGAMLTDNATGGSITTSGYNITVSAAQAVTLPPPSTTVPGAATAGQSYNGSITATNGVPPYSWSINGTAVTSSGVSVGDNITASSTGGSTLSFSGTPSSAQTVALTNVKVVDSANPTTSASNNYSIVVSNSGGTISGQINLQDNCGTTLPTFTVTINTSTPTQVQTNSSGQFSFTGIPAGTYTITPSIAGASSSLFSPTSITGVVVSNGSNITGENFGAYVGYTISGTLTNSSSGTGQTYLYLQGGCNGSQFGTSISAATLSGGGAYQIRGVPPGTYTVYAQMDWTGITSGTGYPGQQGAPNTNNPTGKSASAVSTSNANASGVVSVPSFSLSSATYITPPNNPSIQVIPTVGGALLFFSAPTVSNSNGVSEEAANEYVVNWAQATSTDSAGSYCPLGGGSGGYEFETIAGTHTFYATGTNGSVWILNNTSMGSGSFTSGGTYCFQARAFNTLASTTHPAGAWATQTDNDGNAQGVTLLTSPTQFCSSNCTTVSGTVTIPAGVAIASGAPLYVGIYQNSSSGNGPSAIYAEEIASPASGANTYPSISIPNGSGYIVFGILDQNNDGQIDVGDVTNTRNNNSNGVTFSGGTSPQNLTLPGVNSTAQVQTAYSTCPSCTPVYAVNLDVSEANKLPVAVALSNTTAATPYVITPVDMSRCISCGNAQFQYYATLLSGAPHTGDGFDFTVTYSDGSQETGTTVNGEVTAFGSTGAVVGASDVATNLQTTAGTTPNFSWTDSTNAQGDGFYYSFSLYQSSGTCPSNNCAIWLIPGENSNTNGFSSSITSLTWGTDPTGGGNTPSVGSLSSGDTYNWTISVQDSNGNQAQTSGNDNNP